METIINQTDEPDEAEREIKEDSIIEEEIGI